MDLSFTKIKETCIYVADLQRTRNFYEQKLGLQLINFSEGRHVFFRAGTSVLLCFLAEATKRSTDLPAHFASGQIHFAFETPSDQYEKWKQKILDEGIIIEHEAQWKNDLRSFYFRDPDEHLLEIVEPGIWE